MFAVHCLLVDLHKIRSWLTRKWADYEEGKCDLIVASMATNTAIEICMKWEQDLTKSLNLGGEYELVLLAFLVNRAR